MLTILYRIYLCLVMLPTMLVITILAALLTITGSALGGGRWWGHYPAVVWARCMCVLSLVRVTVKGRENIDKRTSYVFVCNHQGAFDIFAVYGWLNHQFRWMMKQPLRKVPLVGYSCYKAGHIFVDNSSPSAVRRTMEAAEKQLSGGMSLVVFPEGARSWNGKMRAFKRGAFQLATEFSLPVVPVTIDGAFDVMPRFKKMPHWGHIKLTIHRPVLPPEEGYDLPKLMEETSKTINSALTKYGV